MKILVGLSPSVEKKKQGNTYKKIDSLMSLGVKEFFLGYVPPYWFQKFGFEISPNGRQSGVAQFQDKKELKKIVAHIQASGGKVFVTYNSNTVNEVVWAEIKQIYDDILEIGFDGIICSTVTILEFLKEKQYPGLVNIGTSFNVYNSSIIDFLIKNYKINRIILPRELSIREIKNICTQFPQMEFEVFLAGDKCLYNNGFCFSEHNCQGVAHSLCSQTKDLVTIKKKFEPDFKNIIKTKSENEIYQALENTPHNYLKYEVLEWQNYLLSTDNLKEKELLNIFDKLFNKYQNSSNIIYDPSRSSQVEYNQNIINFYQLLIDLQTKLSTNNLEEEQRAFVKKLGEDIKKGIWYYQSKIKEEGLGYNQRMDILSWDRCGECFIKFFNEIPNITALKVPSRGKNIQNVLQTIADLKEGDFEPFKRVECVSGRYCYYNLDLM